MVTIPEPTNHCLIAIWDAYEERSKQSQYESYGINIGSIGHECDRYLWYTLRWAYTPSAVRPEQQRRFDTGNREEERLLDDLEAAGFVVERVDPTTGAQFRVELAGGWLRGKMDGTVTGLPEAPVTMHIVETKSHNEKSFKDLQKKKVQASQPSHYAQCQMYMKGKSLTRCLYLAVNKNTDELYAERIYYDAVFAKKAEARAERIVKLDKAPGRISDNPDIPPCVWCPAKEQCHFNGFTRNGCRTCVDFEFRDNAVGWCTLYNTERGKDEQRLGCSRHLYLPSLVPGEQVDADAAMRTVTYKLHDGRDWTDGGSK